MMLRKINTSLLILTSIMVINGCNKEKLQISGEDGTELVAVTYEVTRKSFVETGGDQSILPAVSKERVSLRIFNERDFFMRVDILDDQIEDFSSSENLPANDYPISSYMEITPASSKVFNKQGELIFENKEMNFDFSGLVKSLRLTPSPAYLRNFLVGGFYFPQENDDQNSFEDFRKSQSSTNPYYALDEFEVYLSSHNDNSGAPIIQETVVRESTNLIELIVAYDSHKNLIGKTSFRYEVENGNTYLKNTHDFLIESLPSGENIVRVTLSQFDSFNINLNF